MIHMNLKTIFLHIPRTGGISIKTMLREHEDCIDYGAYSHEQLSFFKKYYPEEFKKFFKFAVVRNPYARVYSGYKRKHDNASFEKWLTWVEGTSERKRASVLGSQFLWIGDPIEIDCIIQFEKLQEGIDFVCKKIGIKNTLQHLNATKKDDYRKYYTKKTRGIVEKYFYKDIDYFGYTYD